MVLRRTNRKSEDVRRGERRIGDVEVGLREKS